MVNSDGILQLVTDKIKIYKPGLKGGDVEI